MFLREKINLHYILKIIFCCNLTGSLGYTWRCLKIWVIPIGVRHVKWLFPCRTWELSSCAAVCTLSFFPPLSQDRQQPCCFCFLISLCDTLLSKFQLSITMMPKESQSWVFRLGTRYTYLRRLKVSVEFLDTFWHVHLHFLIACSHLHWTLNLGYPSSGVALRDVWMNGLHTWPEHTN